MRVGDDRDVITIDYSGAGAPTPSHQQILTGNGGNPFTESGLDRLDRHGQRQPA